LKNILILFFLYTCRGETINKETITTEERLENGLKHQPERYIDFRDENYKLIEVHDRDTGRIWKKVWITKPKKETGWMWIE